MIFDNGITYYSNINPITGVNDLNLQNEYIMEYKVACHVFYSELFVDKHIIEEYLKSNPCYEIVVDFYGTNDEIKTNTNYGIKFLKSVFLMEKQRDTLNSLKEYYSDYNVTGPFYTITDTSKKAVFIIIKE